MQYRIYNRKTLEYRDGGYVVSYNIDDDYIVNNNSTISIVKKIAPIVMRSTKTVTSSGTYDIGAGNRITNITVDSGVASVSYVGSKYTISVVTETAKITIFYEIEDTIKNVVVGDIIVLIQDSGAFHKGVITALDDTALTISYKSDKELFNDNIINPLRDADAFMDDDESTTIAGRFGVDIVISVLDNIFTEDDGSRKKDPLQTLPLVFQANGDVLDENGEKKMLWTWADDSINVVDWLTELFEKYNLALHWEIDFNIAEEELKSRKQKYIVTLSAITNSGNIIKDNVDMQTITYTTRELPDATVCYVIDSETKEILEAENQSNMILPYKVDENKIFNVTPNKVNGKIVSYTFSQKDNENTDVSGYISLSQDKGYIFKIYNPKVLDGRWIFVYNKDKKVLGAFGYDPANNVPISTQHIANIFDNGLSNSIIAYNKENIPNVKDEIKYIRICYAHGADAWFGYEEDLPLTYEDFRLAIYYLYEENNEYKVTTNKFAENRVLPVKTVVASYNSGNDTDTTTEDVAKEKLIPSQFNQAIEIRINSDSKMFDFANAKFGDLYKIVNERGTIDSVFTGKKVSSKEKWTTLYFGLGRQNYTDIIQMRLRKQRYTEVYNQ